MQSMTGWGRGSAREDGREMTLEMKSVNHRYLDLNFRLPRNLSFLEENLRSWIKDSGLCRGHIDISLTYANTRSDAQTIRIDEGLLMAFRRAMKEHEALVSDYLEPKVTDVLSLCGALTVTEAEESQEIVTELAKACFAEAAQTMREMREKEGKALCADLLSNLAAFDELRKAIAERAPQVPKEYALRLEARLREWQQDGIDPARVAQEVALMADHCAIDEELSRLESHVKQFRDIAEHQTEAGKRLDFLLQEMNRETNTIGSKASDLEITNAVVSGKCLLEKLREQVQNVV